MNDSSSVARCLSRLSRGDQAAARELSTAVYGELKARAEGLVRATPPGAISATTLVHEAYLKLVGDTAVEAGGRERFLALASKIMRDLLVDFARWHGRQKRGGAARRITLATGGPAKDEPEVDVLGIHEALTNLARIDARCAEVVELRYFGGMTREEIAAHLGVSVRTIADELSLGQAWLRKALADRPHGDA